MSDDIIKRADMPPNYDFEAPDLKNIKPDSVGEAKMSIEEVLKKTTDIAGDMAVVRNSVIDKKFAPRIMIYGCGGFGVNIIRNLPVLLGDKTNISYRIFDTSMANVHKEAIPENIEVIMVGEDGKGKLRGTNLEVLGQRVDQLIYTDTVETDLDIIICSLSGGTGSVVGPMIAKAITRKDKPVIVFCVADGASVTDCINTINTLKTFENYGKHSYINMVLFDNMVEGYQAVDKTIVNKLLTFIEAVDLDNVKWLDKSDITTAMRPFGHKLLATTRGLFVTRILNNKLPAHCCYDDYAVPYCHSAIFVSPENKDVSTDNISTVSYQGRWVGNYDAEIVLQFGMPIPDTFNKAYDELLRKGQAAASTQVNQMTIKTPHNTEQHDSGVIY